MARRRAIQKWNKHIFGNIFDVVRVAEAVVRRVEIEVGGNTSKVAQDGLYKAQADLSQALLIEEQFWSQKARMRWLHSGDRNSKFFHVVVKQRRVQSAIYRIKDLQGSWVEKDEDIANEVITFFSDLFSEPTGPAPDMLHLISRLIIEEENKTLEEVPSIEEVRRVIFAMDRESAAGPDGFTGKFFTFSWDVIVQDVYNAVLSFYCGVELPKFITTISIVLIPKVPNPQDFSMGLRQGDPLSPALFVIGAEVLSRDLNNLALQSDFTGFRVPHGCALITHLAFADDVIIFANGSSNSLKRIMRVLELYNQSLGQLVNAQKSGYLVHLSLPPSRRRMIEWITQFARQSFPIRYLGFPLYLGRCRSLYFGAVSQAILGRVLLWKSRLLSPGGKLILIKHVLASVPAHLLSAVVVPSSVFTMIEKVCANFIWGSMAEKSKFHWIRWSQLCYPVEEGGAGFRRLQDVSRAFSCKLW
ncbi:uncharacterized protein [Coffea arabica]|uniref:Reverse transcriptase domain-containing protein n=1 Tax=Coffea arabica TaxID=13443 RepID=A0ABM4UEG8_COFAR